MDAILLVGGLGTRLLPLTKTLPKPLIPLVNVPFVERTVQWLARGGVDHVILSLYYNAELFQQHFTRHNPGIRISFAIEQHPLGTGGAIKNCEQFLRSPRCFIFNGDIFTDLTLNGMLDHHRSKGAGISIALTEVEDPSRFGVIETDPRGWIRSFVEKPPRALARSRNINAGIYIFERAIFQKLPEGPCSVEREIFPTLLEQQIPLTGYHERAYWTDLGTPEDYLQAHRDILTHKVRIPFPYPEITPGVWAGTDIEVADDVLVRPPVVLGDNVCLESGATVGPQVVLGEGVRVEARALVEDSIIWENTIIHADSLVRGSILGRSARIAGHLMNGICEDYSRRAA